MSNLQVVAVTGASGLVGRALVARLENAGCLVRRLVRRPVQDSDTEIYWKPSAGEIDAGELNGVDGVVHLAGENIAGGRWTAERKRRIVESRVQGTRLLSETIAGLKSKPAVLASASAIGFYGDRGDELVDESSPAGNGFLADTCVEWERATAPAIEAGVRVAMVRVGLVLSPEGGLLGKVLPLFNLGLGSVLGDGRQAMSWITRDDLVRVFQEVLENPEINGPVNGTAPNPVSNREFTKTLGRVLGRPTILPAPAFLLRLAAGEAADEMLLAGARVIPTKLQRAGFEFESPELSAALRKVLDKPQA